MREHFSVKDRRKDRIRGCLLGVAIGDALGAPFEHLPPGETARTLEATGGKVLDFHGSWNGPRGGWTDDTSLTLAACRGFLDAARTGRPIPSALHGALWDAPAHPGFRRPGKTILQFMHTGCGDAEAWTNGAVMRIAPAAVYAVLADLSRDEAAHLGLFLARLTHGHPLAVFPAVECVLALFSILKGETRVPADLKDLSTIDGFLREHLRYAQYAEVRQKPMKDLPPSSGLWMWRLVFERLLDMGPGVPWDRLPSFEDGMIRAVSDSYDRDTAGAIAGAILGASWGASNIPERWIAGVEGSRDILQIADAMAETIRPRHDAMTAVRAANSVTTDVSWFRLDPQRARDSLTARMAALQSAVEEDVASGRFGCALLVCPKPSRNAGRLIVLSSPEPVSSFDWKVLNPHLPWDLWNKIAALLEEWKKLPADSPMGNLFSTSRFRCAGSFSDAVEHVIWEATKPGLVPIVLVDGRYGPPDGNVLCRLEAAKSEEDLLGNAMVRLENRCVQAMAEILDGTNVRLDALEAAFLLQAFSRSSGGRTTDELEIVGRFWRAAVQLSHPRLFKSLLDSVERPSVWQETAKWLAEVPKDRLLEIFRSLRASENGHARRLAARIASVLGRETPWAELIELLDDRDPQVREETLGTLDALDASAANAFVDAYRNSGKRPKDLLNLLADHSMDGKSRLRESLPNLRAAVCRLLIRDSDAAVQSDIVEILQDDSVWRELSHELLGIFGEDMWGFFAAYPFSETLASRRLAARLLALVGVEAPEHGARRFLEDPHAAVPREFLRAVKALMDDQRVRPRLSQMPYPGSWLEILLGSDEDTVVTAALDVAAAFATDESLVDRIEALGDPNRPERALAAAGALVGLPNGIPRALTIVENVFHKGTKPWKENACRLMIQRLATERSRCIAPRLLELLDCGKSSLAEAAAYVLAWAGDASAIPPLERAFKRYRSPMIRDVALTLRGDHGTLSASMGFFRAPYYRRLVERAREVQERTSRMLK